jgi:hypothetical protein
MLFLLMVSALQWRVRRVWHEIQSKLALADDIEFERCICHPAWPPCAELLGASLMEPRLAEHFKMKNAVRQQTGPTQKVHP